MNAHLACLYTALAKLQNIAHQTVVITPSELITINSFEESWGGTGSDSRLAALATARFPSTYNSTLPPSFDWRLQFRFPTVERETLEESFRLFDVITNHKATKNLIDAVDLYMRGCRAHQDHNYSLALVMMWTICEQLLQKLWRHYLEDNRQRKIDGNETPFVAEDRKKTLTDSRTFSASVVSEVLSLTNHLPLSTYLDLTKVRKARNRWVHDLVPVTREAAQSSVKVVEQMFSLVEGIDLEVPLNLSIHG